MRGSCAGQGIFIPLSVNSANHNGIYALKIEMLESEVMAQGITSFDMLVSLSWLVRKIKEGDQT